MQKKKKDPCCQLSYCFFTFSSPLHLKLPIIYDTLWSVRNRIFSVQIKLLLLIASETFFDSSVVLSFLVRKAGERVGQLWTNSRKELRRCCSPIGHNNTKHFCAQSGTSILLTVWKWSGESRHSGALPPLLESPKGEGHTSLWAIQGESHKSFPEFFNEVFCDVALHSSYRLSFSFAYIHTYIHTLFKVS